MPGLRTSPQDAKQAISLVLPSGLPATLGQLQRNQSASILRLSGEWGNPGWGTSLMPPADASPLGPTAASLACCTASLTITAPALEVWPQPTGTQARHLLEASAVTPLPPQSCLQRDPMLRVASHLIWQSVNRKSFLTSDHSALGKLTCTGT